MSSAVTSSDGKVGRNAPDRARARFLIASSTLRKPLARDGVSTAGPSCSADSASGSTYASGFVSIRWTQQR